MKKNYLLLFLTFVSVSWIMPAFGQHSTSDTLALRAIQAANFTGSTTLDWNDPDPDMWSGVVWDASTPKRVIRLELANSSANTGSGNTGGKTSTNFSQAMGSFSNTGMQTDLSGVVDVSGLSALQRLILNRNGNVTGVNVSGLASLVRLGLGRTDLTSLDISNLTSLVIVHLSSNSSLTSVNASGCTSLVRLKIKNAGMLNTLNVTGCSALEQLNVSNSGLASLDASPLTSLIRLNARSSNSLSSVTGITNCTNLESLSIANSVIVGEVDVTGLTSLEKMGAKSNEITDFKGIEGISSLTVVNADNNKLSLTNSVKTVFNPIVRVDNSGGDPVANQTFYGAYGVVQGATIDYSAEATVDSNGTSNTTTFQLYNVTGPTLDSTNTTGIFNMNTPGNYYVVMTNSTLSQQTGNISVSGTCTGGPYSAADSAALINIAHNNFGGGSALNWLTEGCPTDWDGVVWDASTPSRVTELNLANSGSNGNGGGTGGKASTSFSQTMGSFPVLGINTNIEGALDFTSLSELTRLSLNRNTGLTGINVSGLMKLERLGLGRTSITSLDVSGLTELLVVHANTGGDVLTTVDASGCTKLVRLKLKQESGLTSLNITGSNNLEQINVKSSGLTNLDLTGKAELIRFTCNSSPLSSLTNLGDATKLESFGIANSMLSGPIDLTGLNALEIVGTRQNEITDFVGIEGHTALTQLNASDNKMFLTEAVKVRFNTVVRNPNSGSNSVANQTPYADTSLAWSVAMDYSSQALIDSNGTTNTTTFELFEAGGSSVYTNTTGIMTFPNGGNYYVEMTNSTVTITTGNINVAYPPLVAGWTSNLTGCKPAGIAFDNISTGGTGGELYFWDFGDGSDTVMFGPADFTHNFNNAGEFEVSMLVFDTTGWGGNPANLVLADQITNTISIYGLNVINSVDSICPNEEAQFGYEGFGETFAWDFGDGNMSTEENPTHSYVAAGNYPVKLVITSAACGADSMTTMVAVSNSTTPDASFSMNPSSGNSCPNDLIGFQGVISSTGTYVWDYDDGGALDTTDYLTNYSYTTAGTYNVTLAVTNVCGNTSMTSNSVNISNAVPFGNIGLFTLESCPGDNITAVIFGQDGEASFQNYAWDFDNGDVASTSSPAYAYPTIGNYDISVTVTNGCGVDTTLVGNIDIRNDLFPTLDDNFGIPDEGNGAHCPGDSVLFFYAGTGTPTWDFGDGSAAVVATESLELEEEGNTFTVLVARHAYATVGNYNAVISVSNSCGNVSVDSVPVVINNSSPVNGDFVFEVAPQGGDHLICQDVNFLSFGGGTYAWDFGDGDTLTTTASTVQHDYASAGTYSVELTVTNGCGNMDLISYDVDVMDIPMNLSVTDEVCAGDSNGLIDLTATGVGSLLYSWSDGQSTEDISATAGTYTVTVTDITGCSNTDSVVVNSQSNMMLTTNTQDASCGLVSNGKAWVTAVGGSGTYSYSWSPVAGATDTIANVLPLLHTVTVTDLLGCSAVATAAVATTTPPSVDAGSNVTICEGQSVTLTATSPTTIAAYAWDNGLGTGNGFTVSPTTTTTYSVAGTDISGCVGNDLITVSVDAQPTVVACDGCGPLDYSMICAGNDLVLQGAFTNAAGVIWSAEYSGTSYGSTVFSDSNSVNSLFDPEAPGIPVLPASSVLQVDLILTAIVSGPTVCTIPSDTAKLTIVAAPTVDAGLDQAICDNETDLALSPTAAYGITSEATAPVWTSSTGNGSFAPAGSLTTTYTFDPSDVVAGNSLDLRICVSRQALFNVCPVVCDTVTVDVLAAPTVSAGIDTSVCGGNALVLSGTGAASYVWNNGVTDGASFTPSGTTTYTVTGTAANNCTATDSLVVTVNAPTVNAGVDMILCNGDSTSLSATGTATTYSWDNGLGAGANHDVTPTTTTTYVVTGTDAATCIATDTVVVTVNASPMPVITYNNDSATTGSFASYQWYLDGAAISGATSQTMTSDDLASSGNGSYTVEVTDTNGCMGVSDSVAIVIGGIGVEFGTSVSIFPNPSAGQVTIQMGQFVPGMSLSLRNELGQIVLEEEFSNASLELDLPTGVYIVRLQNAQYSVTRRLVITK